MIAKAAKAMYDAQVEQVRKQVEQTDLELPRILRVCHTAMAESDRSAAVLLFALAEDLMLSALKRNMSAESPARWKAATESNGLLATANDRIALLELLEWIRPSLAHDVRLLKSIRNRFAHHADVSTF